MKRALLAVSLLAQCSGAMADDLATSCALMNRVNADGGIRLTSNALVELGLCLVTKGLVEAIAGGDKLAEKECGIAARQFTVEFHRRFPRRFPDSVVGSC
jgi:hypothetical protein